MDGSLAGVQVRDREQLEQMRKRAGRQLPERMEVTQALLGELRDTVDTLAGQLGPVLAPQGPSPVLQSTPAEPTTELAAFMAHTQQQLRELVAAVRDLIDRIDL